MVNRQPEDLVLQGAGVRESVPGQIAVITGPPGNGGNAARGEFVSPPCAIPYADGQRQRADAGGNIIEQGDDAGETGDGPKQTRTIGSTTGDDGVGVYTMKPSD